MCYDDSAKPPLPPGEAQPARGEDLVLTSADGSQFAAYIAYPQTPRKAQVIIYPDVRGLHQFYKELALRFAEVGITAIALDYFGRTAGLTSRDESFEFMPHVMQLNLDRFFEDVASTLAALTERSGTDGPVYVVGFCMGGTLDLLSGTNPNFGFAGLTPFYAGMTRNFGGKGTLLEHAHNVKYPVLALFGGNDPGIPQSNIDELEQKLNQAGVENEVVVYAGAPHSFFDRTASQYAEASGDAWKRIMAFVKD